MPAFGRFFGKEAFRATCFFAVIYASTFCLLVAYKLQTRNYYLSEQESLLQEVQTRQFVLAKERVEAIQRERIAAAAATPTTAPVNDLSEYESELQDLIHQLEQKEQMTDQTLAHLSKIRNEIEDIRKRVGEVELTTLDGTVAKGDYVPSTNHLRRLLSITDLAGFSTEDLDSMFQLAIQEGVDMFSNRFTLKLHDKVLAGMFASAYPERHRLVAPQSCSGRKSTPTKKVMPPIPRGTAQAADLQQRVDKVDNMLKRRSEAKDPYIRNLLLPDTVMKLNRSLKPLSIGAANDVIEVFESKASTKSSSSSPTKSSSSSSSCLGREQIDELLDEALLAVLRKANVRSVLRKKAIELDPNAQEIILDADLPPIQPPVVSRPTVNLRRVLDTPLLARTAEWIDNLVEACGGYNDQLDNYLDSTFGGGRESIGEVMVRRLLDESGKVELPHPKLVAKKLPGPLKSLADKL